jgi:hypothetical protein
MAELFVSIFQANLKNRNIKRRRMDEARLDFKICERPVAEDQYEPTPCPIADRCKYKNYRMKAEACICCSDLICTTLKEEGYTVFRSGRAILVVLPSKMKDKRGYDVGGLKVIVFSDPDSSVSHRDEIFITGFRFGIDDILLNRLALYTVHKDFGSEVKYCIGRLVFRIWNVLWKDEEKVKRLVKQLKHIGRELGEEIDDKHIFGHTYLQ